MRSAHGPFGFGWHGDHRWQTLLATTAAPIMYTPWSARTSALDERCGEVDGSEKTFFPSPARGRGCRSPGDRCQLRRMFHDSRAALVRVARPHRRGTGTYPSLTRALSGHRRKTAQTLARDRSSADEDGDVEPHPDAHVGCLEHRLSVSTASDVSRYKARQSFLYAGEE
jgi:hypothetical protein